MGSFFNDDDDDERIVGGWGNGTPVCQPDITDEHGLVAKDRGAGYRYFRLQEDGFPESHLSIGVAFTGENVKILPLSAEYWTPFGINHIGGDAMSAMAPFIAEAQRILKDGVFAGYDSKGNAVYVFNRDIWVMESPHHIKQYNYMQSVFSEKTDCTVNDEGNIVHRGEVVGKATRGVRGYRMVNGKPVPAKIKMLNKEDRR